MTQKNDNPNDPNHVDPPPDDDLESLLHVWHKYHAQRASAGRDRIIDALSHAGEFKETPDLTFNTQPALARAPGESSLDHRRRHIIRRLIMNRYSTVAAALILLAVMIATFTTRPGQETFAQPSNVIMAPEAGRLDAMDTDGNVIGPCPLEHTDVEAEISGHFVRVTLVQKYRNPYADKIEAVYTFPLSHRGAVDRMTMTIGDRVIIGEVHEREVARAIYESARKSGYVASLLEQERPNIFTQSVANIEPNAEIDITISYVELLESKDGTYSFEFPMVVGPRYIPGTPKEEPRPLPTALKQRRGVILLSPAKIELVKEDDQSSSKTMDSPELSVLLDNASPIRPPDSEYWKTTAAPNEDSKDSGDAKAPAPRVQYRFAALYGNGSKEQGEVYADGTGQINGRWFCCDIRNIKKVKPGEHFAPDTDQVPDASRITPMPVPPGTRSGHDISLKVAIDGGGRGIRNVKSHLHEIDNRSIMTGQSDSALVDGQLFPTRGVVELKNAHEIPNRDFVLTWQLAGDGINEAAFTHTGELGNYFTLIIAPPSRVDNAEAVARELIFVLDTSGSMSGFPIEKAKSVMAKAIDNLRPQDTFNLITFAGSTQILWDQPRPFTEENRKIAQEFLAGQSGRGGTEMMKAINAALVQKGPGDTTGCITLETLADTPADGREVTVYVDWRKYQIGKLDIGYGFEGRNPMFFELPGGGGIETHIPSASLAKDRRNGANIGQLIGKWITKHGHAIFVVDRVEWNKTSPSRPLRVVCFMTDGYVGNDMAIIDAIHRNAATTRVFSFGIGNSVNRYLLDGMARAGRGEVEYVLLASDADAAADRFAKRIQTPVLTDIQLDFSDNLEIIDRIPEQIPDLFDVKPLVIHGRYTQPGRGTLTIRGNTGTGPFERRIAVDLPESQPAHDVIATLWARARIEELMNKDLQAAQQGNLPEDLKREVIRIGERHGIMSQFTSFVAVEKARVTIGGEPRLVAVPIEMPQGVSYEGVFGKTSCAKDLFTRDDTDKLYEGLRSCIKVIQEAEQAGKETATLAVPEGSKASEAAELLNTVIRTTAKSRGQQEQDVPITVVANETTNTLMISGDSQDVLNVRNFMTTLDAPEVITDDLALYEKGLSPRRSIQPEFTNGVAVGAGVSQFGFLPAAAGSSGRVTGNFSHYYSSSNGPAMGLPNRLFKRGTRASAARYASLGRSRGVRSLDSSLHQKVANQWSGFGKDKNLLVNGDFDGDGNVDFLDYGVLGDVSNLDAEAAFSTARPAEKAPTGLPVSLRVRVVLAIARLVASDQFDAAHKLADALFELDEQFEIGAKMRDVLADESLTPAHRKTRIAELARRVTDPIDKALHEARLRIRLDDALFQLATDKETKPGDVGLTDDQGAIRVTVLVSDVDDTIIDNLKKAGLRMETSAPPMKLVVGTVSRDRLETLALLDNIRKIEATELR